ncbi:Uncharacterised protein (plasmid) [Tsukamurella tyrosinosolvens]|uniref:Uncharacterized protein n=1 Tax=Tsukamurella tyrosinosolvens TaxID=57704 RepID=A0A1H4U794_TSUTY|nr:hypothetical protein [Tsukamurella tyrosinosolvens]KXO93006.1 hypothetical protein AXK58_14140 [Tsukamurella tyrosinosolvens]SEC64622.1 hypothetical protein SAMN04489793_2803 [Tsukamurella tyrosinosolvens]VEH94034.1 Uncharacterised protein [Tsukamurella tyrosinosolvens]
MSIRSTNLAHSKIAELLEECGGAVEIIYGFNSGGYESNVYFITADGGALGIDTVIAEIDQVDFTDEADRQWFIVGYQVNYEDHDLIDDHTGAKIPAAYA